MGYLGFWEMLGIFLGLLAINLIFIAVNLLKKGQLANNMVMFPLIQGYIVLVAILLMVYQSHGRVMGYAIGILFIIAAIACMVLKFMNNFDLARILSAESVGLVYLSFWYSEKFVMFFIITIVIYVVTIGYKYYVEMKR